MLGSFKSTASYLNSDKVVNVRRDIQFLNVDLFQKLPFRQTPDSSLKRCQYEFQLSGRMFIVMMKVFLVDSIIFLIWPIIGGTPVPLAGELVGF